MKRQFYHHLTEVNVTASCQRECEGLSIILWVLWQEFWYSVSFSLGSTQTCHPNSFFSRQKMWREAQARMTSPPNPCELHGSAHRPDSGGELVSPAAAFSLDISIIHDPAKFLWMETAYSQRSWEQPCHPSYALPPVSGFWWAGNQALWLWGRNPRVLISFLPDLCSYHWPTRGLTSQEREPQLAQHNCDYR